MPLLYLLNNIILGILEDNTNLFVYSKLIDPFTQSFIPLAGYPFGTTLNMWQDNQILFWIIYYGGARILNQILLYNLIVIFTVITTFISAYIFFGYFTKHKTTSMILSLTFIFSGYFSYRIRSHLDLAQIWLVILFLLSYLQESFISDSNKGRPVLKYALLGMMLALITGISNYLGFFSFLFIVTFRIALTAVSLIFFKNSLVTKKVLLHHGLMALAFLAGITLFLMPYINGIYLHKSSPITASVETTMSRPLDDVIMLTSRPWYYLFPSVDNPFYGKITEKILKILQEDWGYFLTQNYFKSEHSASYLGWNNIIFAIYGVTSIYKNFLKTRNRDSQEFKLLVLLATMLILVSFTMPPFFTIAGLKIFTPSYALWEIFPMFRTLSRLGFLILLIFLIFTGFGYRRFITNYLTNIPDKFRRYRKLILVLFTVFISMASISEFFIPIKITDVSSIPKVFTYLKSLDNPSPIVVYPLDKTKSALFWLPYYQLPLLNPQAYTSPDRTVNTSTLTKSLLTCEGMLKAKQLGAKHLIHFNNVSNPKANNTFMLMTNAKILTEVASFQESANPSKFELRGRLSNILKVSHTDQSDSAIVYEINLNEHNIEQEEIKNFCQSLPK